MKTRAAAVGAVVFAGSACAQNFTMWLEAGDVSPSGSFTVTMFADSDLGGTLLSVSVGLDVTPLTGSGSVSDITWQSELQGSYADFTNDGYLGDGMYGELSIGWIFACGIFPCVFTDLGQPIGHFTVHADPDTFETYQIDIIPGPAINPLLPYTIEAADQSGALYNDSQGSLQLNGATVSVPASNVLVCMSLGGYLVMYRRRRL